MQPDQRTANLINILTGARPTTPTVDGPQAAIVSAVVNGGVMFTIPSYHQDWAFGPAPYQALPGATPAVPPVGTPCVATPISGLASDPQWMVSCFQGWPQIAATAAAVSAWGKLSSVLPAPQVAATAPTASAWLKANSVLPTPYTESVLQYGVTSLNVSTTAPNSFNVSLPSTSTAGNDILIACGQYSGSGANAQTFTATSYTSLAVVNNVANVPTVQILRRAGAPATSTVSVAEQSNGGGGAYAGCVISELGGVNSSASAEVLYTGHSSGAVSSFSVSGATAPSASGELFFMAVSFQVTTGSETSSVTTPSGWTPGGAWTNNTSGNITYTFWQIGGSSAPSPTLTGFSSNQWVSVAIISIPHA